ncbi:MAG: permease [Kiloniellales bacterium]
MSLPGSSLASLTGRLPRPSAWIAVALAAVLLAVLFPEPAFETAGFVTANLLAMAPVILLAAGLTGLVRASGAETVLARVFAGREGVMILSAAALGAITPICGLGVLPVIASLLAAGTPLAPIMAFWLASPITDPAMLAITAGTLGPAFAVAKTLAAFAIGVISGFATQALLARGAFPAPLRSHRLPKGLYPEQSAGDCPRPASARGQPPTGTVPSAAYSACDSACAGPDSLDWRIWRAPARRLLFLAEARGAILVMLKWLSLAFALESLLRASLPPEIIADHVGVGSDWAIPLAVLIGTPLYVDGYAALPLVRGLIELGMAPGAAMAFLVAGGITSLYASVAVLALVRLPLFLWYLVLAIAGSALSGYAFQAYLSLPWGGLP